MGNNIYTLITGLWPFYEEDRYTPVIKMVKKRMRPYVDPRWSERSYIESQLVEIMVKMWRHVPEERPDIFTVVEFLKDAKRHAMDPENAKDRYVAREREDTEPVEHTDTIQDGEEFDEAEEAEGEESDEAEEAEEFDEAEEAEGEEVDEAEEAEDFDEAEEEEVDEADEAEETRNSEADSN
jgi:hypothetical protein